MPMNMGVYIEYGAFVLAGIFIGYLLGFLHGNVLRKDKNVIS